MTATASRPNLSEIPSDLLRTDAAGRTMAKLERFFQKNALPRPTFWAIYEEGVRRSVRRSYDPDAFARAEAKRTGNGRKPSRRSARSAR